MYEYEIDIKEGGAFKKKLFGDDERQQQSSRQKILVHQGIDV